MDILSKLPKIKNKEKKRVGRGLSSGKGHGTGRGGNRHQKGRENIPLHFEGGQARLAKKYPLLRGKSKNKSIKKTISITLDTLNKFANNEKVDREALLKLGILRKSAKTTIVKVLSTGKLAKKLTVNLPVTAGARKKIEQAGGKVE